MKSIRACLAAVAATPALLAPVASHADDIAFALVGGGETVRVPVASGPKVTAITAPHAVGDFAVEIVVPDDIAAKVCEMTKQNVGKAVSIMVGCTVVSEPVVQEPLCNGVLRISGVFTRAEAETLASRIRDGAKACN